MSSRRLYATLDGLGKLYQSRKDPEVFFFKAGFGDKKKRGLNHFLSIRECPTDALQRVIRWISEEYAAAMDGRSSPYLHMDWDTEEENAMRISLDLCYRELARRVEKI